MKAIWLPMTVSTGAAAYGYLEFPMTLGVAAGGLAVEYDVYYQSVPGSFSRLCELRIENDTSSPGYGIDFLTDQNGITGIGAPAVTTIALGHWYHRVLTVPPGALSFGSTTQGFRVGLHCTGAGNYEARIANVRLTRYRETVFWVWREGMARPSTVFSANASGGSFGSLIDTTGTLPSYCAQGSDQMLDDISHQRRTGGRLNSFMFWDGTKRSFMLSDIIVDEYQRQELEAFYEVFRRESVLYQHRSNYPAEWVRFERPPKFTDVGVRNGLFIYRVEISLLRR